MSPGMVLIKSFLFLYAVLAVLYLVQADDGTAVHNNPPYIPSTCFGLEDDGTLVAAASETLFAGGAACGKFYKVICTDYVDGEDKRPCIEGASVTVKIVDPCPTSVCGRGGTIALSREAFTVISNIGAAKIKINYQQI